MGLCYIITACGGATFPDGRQAALHASTAAPCHTHASLTPAPSNLKHPTTSFPPFPLQLGNVFIGVQPVLGVEGDPMRLLFERDLTPHPQYAAFYKWLQVRLAGAAAGNTRV